MENKVKSGKGKEVEKLGTKRKRKVKVKRKRTQLGSDSLIYLCIAYII